MREVKKIRERQLFERAQRLVAVWPAGIVDDQGESPDLVITAPGRLYGVEVTERIEGKRRAQVELHRAVCDRARRLYLQSIGIAGLSVAVIFRNGISLKKSDQQPFAEELATVVARQAPRNGPERLNLQLREGHNFSSSVFSTIFVHRVPEATRDNWRSADAWWVPRISAQDVDSEIQRKEPKIADYLCRVPAVWLLLAADGFNASSAASIDDEVFAASYVTRFAGVVLLEEAMDRATLLNVTSPPAAC